MGRMKQVVWSAVVLLFAGSASVADEVKKSDANLLFEGGTDAILATKNNFRIIYTDEVTGGCLPKPQRLRDKMELQLRRNGIGFNPDGSEFDDTIILSALGFRAGSNYCAVSLTVKMKTWVAVRVPYSKDVPSGEMTYIPYVHTMGHYLLTGRRGSMQKRLEKVASELGDQTYLSIARARDRLFPQFPSIEKNYKENGKKNGSILTP
jgi:hypothetical protein